MMRYMNADESLTDVFRETVAERFPSFINLKFKLVYDTKKRHKGGRIILASVELPSAKLKYFSTDEYAEEGYDYILFVDMQTWDMASAKDRKRLISHELRHVFIDEKGVPKLTGHEIEDFYEEMKLNADDPEWARNLASLVTDYYDQEKDMSKGNFGG